MTQFIYFNIRLVIAGILLNLGACLLWGVIPQKLRGTIFDTSRKCIALAIMAMPISTILVYLLSLRTVMYNLHIASYLTACYVISILVTVGFVPLLGGKLNFANPHFKRRFTIDLLSVPVFTMPIIIANIFGNEQFAAIAKVFTSTLLIVVILYQSYTFYNLYKEAIRRGNNYYSDDIEVDIRWIVKSVFAIFTMEIVCAVSVFFYGVGYELELLLTIYRAVTIAYVFAQFIIFMKKFETMIALCENSQIDEVDYDPEESYHKSLSAEQKQQIAQRLDLWVNKRGYTTGGITIDDVAIEVATNRTYLSIYINSTFGCSFKAWITQQRIERAKTLLMGNDTTIDIAKKVGFSSPQSFMHSFKRSEEVTPTQWRTTNKK